MSYRPKYFKLQELVDPDIFKEQGEQAWKLLSEDMLITLDHLRELLGPLTVNNWHIGGSYKESGLRKSGTSTGAKFSRHKLGDAFDLKSKRYKPTEMLELILANEDKFPFLKRIENPDYTPTWLHVDGAPTGKSRIYIFNP